MDFNSPVHKNITDLASGIYRIAVKALIIRDEKLLVVKETEGFYGLPGGGLEYNDTIKNSLLRELKEEVGLDESEVSISDLPIHLAENGVLYGIPRFAV